MHLSRQDLLCNHYKLLITVVQLHSYNSKALDKLAGCNSLVKDIQDSKRSLTLQDSFLFSSRVCSYSSGVTPIRYQEVQPKKPKFSSRISHKASSD